ncbi:MAG: glycine betaine ABC transporter substrate-binding protein [Actinomycetota bacterium]
MTKRRWGFLAMLAVLAVLAAACSDVSNDNGASQSAGATGATGGTSEVPDNSGTTINLAISPWTGSDANVAVAQVLLQDKLGYTVKTTKIDEYAQFPALANGQLSATLEVWPSGHAKDYKKFIDGNNGVVDGGQLGVIGQIGWWIPTYMLTDHPELASWEGLKTNAAMFQTAESGDAGQILDGDPSFVTFDQPIADNLGLDLKVVYGGSEAAELAALDAAYQKQGPILMYFWTPHWAQSKYDLTMVQLPDVTPACEAAAAGDASQYACAYPEDDLYKAFNADLQTDAPAAFALLSAMSYTNDDQNAIALDINNGMSPEEAAQKWVDANPDIWQPWVDAGLAAQA